MVIPHSIEQADAASATRLAAGIVRPSVAVVIGASGGLGSALANALAGAGFVAVHALSRSSADVPGCTIGKIDVTDEASIAEAAARITAPIGLLIVATGVLHAPGIAPEKTWRMIDGPAFAEVLRVNTIGPALVAKHFLPLVPRRGRAIFAALSARVGSLTDNRSGGWHAYRASKAALNMVIANLAIELRTRNPDALAVGLHPGTVNTGLSAPFQRGVSPERLFTPAYSAAQLFATLSERTPGDSGGCFAWDGARISA